LGVAEPRIDEVFGPLQWDGALDAWLGSIDWSPGLHTEVVIWPLDGDPAAGLRHAHVGLAWARANEQYARREVAAQMAVYQAAWRGWEDTPVTPDEFAAAAELVRFAVAANGEVGLCYDGGELLSGCQVECWFGADGSLVRHTLVG
jgi:hypothetical protein